MIKYCVGIAPAGPWGEHDDKCCDPKVNRTICVSSYSEVAEHSWLDGQVFKIRMKVVKVLVSERLGCFPFSAVHAVSSSVACSVP